MATEVKHFFTADIDIFKSKVLFVDSGEEMSVEEAIQRRKLEYLPIEGHSVKAFERVYFTPVPRPTKEERLRKLKRQ